jgi:hypothetical protein
MGWQTGQRGLIKILIKLIREKRERDKKKTRIDTTDNGGSM